MRKDLIVAGLFFLPGIVFGVALDRYWLLQSQQITGVGAASTQPAGGGRPTVALDQFNMENLKVSREEILSGGPRKDGIPSLSHVEVAAVGEADFLAEGDRMVGVTINGQSRAYPVNVLNYHEAVNDVVGGVPIAAIYCPLCDSVSIVDRRMGDKTLEFGISGLLMNSNVLLYDQVDNALWSQVKLEAISGPFAGQSLTHLPFELTTFGQWKRGHPDGKVMTFNTGHRRDYHRNGYADRGYFATDEIWFPISRHDDRMGVKERVVGVRLGSVARAYPLAAIEAAPGHEINDEVGGQTIKLRADGDGSGVTIVEAPKQAQVVHTFWFAWSAFHPETDIYGAAGGG